MATSIHRGPLPNPLLDQPATHPAAAEMVDGTAGSQPSWMNSTERFLPVPAQATSSLFQHFAEAPGGAQAGAAMAPSGTPAAAQNIPSTLTDHIARSIAIYETNRGGTQPIAKESSLDTTAGIHASVRSVSQATVPWIIDALEQHPELRQNASQPLTAAEVAAAHQRMTTTDSVLREVDGAGRQTAQQFAQAHAAQLQASGFSEADVTRMMQSRDLHAEISAANARVQRLPAREREAAIQREVAAIPEAQRVGLGAGSLRSYIRTPANWGENRAGWERLSLERMADGVGNRVIETGTHNDGLSMMSAVMSSQVTAEERAHPGNTDAVVRGVAGHHNANRDYPAGVLGTYHRLYPGAAPAGPTPRPNH